MDNRSTQKGITRQPGFWPGKSSFTKTFLRKMVVFSAAVSEWKTGFTYILPLILTFAISKISQKTRDINSL